MIAGLEDISAGEFYIDDKLMMCRTKDRDMHVSVYACIRI